MSTSIKFMRGLLWSVPIVAVSLFAILQASAGTTSAVIPTGKISTTSMGDYTSYPNGSVVGVTNIAPVAMIVESTDEQLFYKAYTDYTDMTNKGSPDITYNNTFQYQGYFNSSVCYSYVGGTFVPAAVATNYTCSGKYSGNFMNWVTMSRLDMLRFAPSFPTMAMPGSKFIRVATHPATSRTLRATLSVCAMPRSVICPVQLTHRLVYTLPTVRIRNGRRRRLRNATPTPPPMLTPMRQTALPRS